MLDMDYWRRAGGEQTWRDMHAAPEPPDRVTLLRRCTYSGRPFGEQEFVAESRSERSWHYWGLETLAAAA